MQALKADGLAKRFVTSRATIDVLARVSLDVAMGEWVTLLGPSGCGKTTLLRILAGVLPPDEGTVSCSGNAPLGRVAFLPQLDTLLPWRTALDNALLPAEIDRRPREPARRAARELFAAFGLAGAESLYPAQLSGGMRQRVEVARTFLAQRDVLLLDEPLGALDPITRAALQGELRALWAATRPAVVLVTHDVEEALLLSDRVLLLSPRPAKVLEETHCSATSGRRRDAPEIVAERARMLAKLTGGGS
ncbi:MAG: ABC transporter ATP-binding protein [Candidatus Bipolaricaulota bacterium]